MTGQERIANLLIHLYSGQAISIQDIMKKYGVVERTAYRDIDIIKNVIGDQGITENDLKVNLKTQRYSLTGIERLSIEEVIAILKIILPSRAFSKKEMQHVTTHLLATLSENDQRKAKDIITGELIDYLPLKKNRDILPLIQEFIEHIDQNTQISYDYLRGDEKAVTRQNTLVALYFSDFYFYIMFYLENRRKPIPYRLDNIKNVKIIETDKKDVLKTETIDSQYYRKKTHYMYSSGKEKTFQFKYWGNEEAALNRLPGSKTLEKHPDYVVIQSEAIDNGVMIWLLSQGDKVQVTGPPSMVNEIKDNIQRMLENYK